MRKRTDSTSTVARRGKTALLAILFAANLSSSHQGDAQAQAFPKTSHKSLSDYARDLPATPGRADPEGSTAFPEAMQASTEQERLAVIPRFATFIDDPRPEVRAFALGTIGLIFYAFPSENGSNQSPTLPLVYVPQIAAHLLDSDGNVRRQATLALNSANRTFDGDRELIRVLLPLLPDPGVFTRFPDPFFTESNAFMLSMTAPEQREEVSRQQQRQRVILLPAVGPSLLSLLVSSPFPTSPATDDALVAFLDRPDQTVDTLSDCLHYLALSRASERVNNEALTRVFDQAAMSVFLIQFLNNLQLTPKHLATQKARLLALSNDESTAPYLRRAAATVAVCWGVDPHAQCAPSQQDFYDASNAPRPQP